MQGIVVNSFCIRQIFGSKRDENEWRGMHNGDLVTLGGLGVTCSPRDQISAGSNLTEVDGFFQDVKILRTSPPGGTLSWGSRA